MKFCPEKIRELRKQKKLTQEKLARKAKIARPYLSKIERGKVIPSIPTLESLAEVLGVPVSYFFEEFEESEAAEQNQTRILDIELYLQKILSGEIPIHFSGVDKLTPEVIDDIRTVLKAALNHIRVQKELAKKVNGPREEVVKMWTCILPKESDSFCSPNASESAFKTLPLPWAFSTPTTSPPASASP